MKKLFLPLTCLIVLLADIARGDDLPFFAPLREEVVNQLTIASNTVPLDKKLLSALRTNLKTIDKTKPALIGGSAALGTLAKALGKTSLSNTFLPIVIDTRTVYINTMETEMDGLTARLADTIPGKAQTVGQTALDKATVAIDAVGTNSNLTLSLKALSKAATAVAAAEKAVIKAETAKPGANFVTATITESNQGTNPFKPVKKTILEAYYDTFNGEIVIDAGELQRLSGGRAQIRYLEITAAVPGEGTHTLSLTNEAYAVYQRTVAANIREFEEENPEFEFDELYFTIDPINHSLGTGTMTINVDFEANIVWGTFTFATNGSGNTGLEVSMTGSFLVRLSTYEEF